MPGGPRILPAGPGTAPGFVPGTAPGTAPGIAHGAAGGLAGGGAGAGGFGGSGFGLGGLGAAGLGLAGLGAAGAIGIAALADRSSPTQTTTPTDIPQGLPLSFLTPGPTGTLVPPTDTGPAPVDGGVPVAEPASILLVALALVSTVLFRRISRGQHL